MLQSCLFSSHICPAVPHIFLTALLSYAAADFPHGHGETLLATENSQPVNYERKPASSAVMIQMSHIHLMLNRLAPCPGPAFQYRQKAAWKLNKEAEKFPDSLLPHLDQRVGGRNFIPSAAWGSLPLQGLHGAHGVARALST